MCIYLQKMIRAFLSNLSIYLSIYLSIKEAGVYRSYLIHSYQGSSISINHVWSICLCLKMVIVSFYHMRSISIYLYLSMKGYSYISNVIHIYLFRVICLIMYNPYQSIILSLYLSFKCHPYFPIYHEWSISINLFWHRFIPRVRL